MHIPTETVADRWARRLHATPRGTQGGPATTRFGLRAALALSALLVACAGAPPQPGPKPDPLRGALAPVFEADIPAALQRLAALPPGALDAAQMRIRACVEARFAGPAAEPVDASLPAPGAAVLAAYRRYWTAAMTKQSTAEEAERRLARDLAPWAGSAATEDLDARVDAASAALEAQGWFVLGGVTPPLRELMLWRKQTVQRETVMLPGGPIDVKVTLLDDFASFGWAGWGTCDRSHTGGWTTDDGIMVVAPSWVLDSEDYRVSLLAHEAQHFSDRARYPQLSAPDLEYRAKLVELVFADRTQGQLLVKFATEAHHDRALPHAFASDRLVARLRERLGGAAWPSYPRETVRAAALAELAAHGAALDALGAASARSALAD